MTDIKTQLATDLVETFLTVNQQEITKPYRDKLRKSAEKAIHNDEAAICLSHCPAHLRDAFRRIVIAEAYKARVKGQFFRAEKKETWI